MSGWPAILLAPLATPIALIVRLLPLKKTQDLTAAEVAEVLRNCIAGSGGDWDWDDFESVPIADLELDQIRREAALAGPPNADIAKLTELLRRAEDLINTRS